MRLIITLLYLSISLGFNAQNIKVKNPYYTYDTVYNNKGFPIYVITKDEFDDLQDSSFFDNNGILIESKSYDFEGEIQYKEIWKYNKKGNLTERIQYNSKGEFDLKNIFKFDKNGYKIEIASYNSKGKLSRKRNNKFNQR